MRGEPPVDRFRAKFFCGSGVLATFVVIALTGLWMAFNKGQPFLGLSWHQIEGLHYWMSFAFLFVAICHVVLNWRQLCCYFANRTARRAARVEWVVAFSVVVALCAVVLATTPAGSGRGPGGPQGMASTG